MGGSFHNQWPYLTRVSNNDTDCMQVSIVASRKHIISLIGWLWSQLYSRVVSDIGICQGLSSQSPFSLIRHLHVPSRRVWWGVEWRVTAVKIGCMIWSRQKTCHVAEKDAFSAPKSIEVVRQQDYIQCGLLNMKNKYETRERTQMGYQSGAKALGLERLIATSAIRILWILEVS